jgi:hypothetical protein
MNRDSLVGIQKYFVGVEIPHFDVPNKFSGQTMSFFLRGGIRSLDFNKYKYLKIINVAIPRFEPRLLTWQLGLLPSKLPMLH